MFNRLKILGQRIEGVVTQTSKILNILGMICAAMLMLLICGDVLGRKLFNKPITGILSISQFTLVCAVFCSVAYCAILKGHVNVDMVVSRLKGKGQAILNLITGFISLALFFSLTWAATVASVNSWKRAEVSLDQLEIPVWPFRAVLVFGIIMLCLVLLINISHLIAKLMEK